jgi:hypothetical protein
LVSLFAEDLLPIRQVADEVQSAAQVQLESVQGLVCAYMSQPPTPQATLDLENAIQDELREFGRRTMEVVCNSLEPDSPENMPKQVELEGQAYSRKNAKTNNRGGIGTLFGTIQRSAKPRTTANDLSRRWNCAWALSQATPRPLWPSGWVGPPRGRPSKSCWNCSGANTV